MKLTLPQAYELIEDWPNSPECPSCGGKLMMLPVVSALCLSAKSGELARIFPIIGVLGGFFESSRPEHRHPKWKWWLIWKIYLFLCARASKIGDRPGVNDMLMARWMITRSPRYVLKMADRAKREDQIGWTCRWMLNSARERIPQLNAQLRAIGEPAFYILGDFPT